MFLPAAFFLVVLVSGASSLRNVTVDDTSQSILYLPPSSWTLSASTPLDVGGSHRLTQDQAAIANFTFTGVAVYFMSPRWPYRVNTMVSLDARTPALLDLTDRSRPDLGQGPETVPSSAVWGIADLPNTQHSLIISVGPGEPYAVVDALIYTVLDSTDTSTSPAVTSITKSTITSTPPGTPTSGGLPTSTAPSKKHHVWPIVVGIVLGVCGLTLFAFLLWYCLRPPKRPQSEAWTVPNHSYAATSHISTAHMNSNSSLSGFMSPYSVLHQPTGSWDSQGFGVTPTMPGAMPLPATTITPRPFSQLSSSGSSATDEMSWQGPTSQVAQRYSRTSNRFTPSSFSVYQPNTLSTITETSSPPGGTTSLINSPSTYQAEFTNNNVHLTPEFEPPQRGSYLGYSSYSPIITESQQSLPATRKFVDSSPRPPPYTAYAAK